jgi:deoxyxylulose-5-phosphate synthase
MSTARPSRIAADLFESATRVGKLESRSATQQLDHWARVGRNVSMHQTAARRRVEAALAGTVELADLSPDEQIVVNAELDVAIAEQARRTSFGSELAAEGITTVALGDDGILVAYHPDGTTSPLVAG